MRDMFPPNHAAGQGDSATWLSKSKEQEQGDLSLLLRPVNQWPKFDNYRPLTKDGMEIRLLRVRHHKDQIHGTIQHMRFDQRVPYEALSYCWGAPADTKPIYIDGRQVLVRVILWSFLNNLCARKHDLPIWLDAICINQRDLQERDSQVRIMGRIYSRAVRTIAWLGDADDDSNYALAYLKRSQAPELFSSNARDDIQHRALQAAAQLMQRSYWSRLWIVQEIGLSKQVLLLCGSRDVDLHVLASALEVTGGHDNLRPLMDIRNRFIPSVRAQIELETRKPLTSSSKCLLELITAFGNRHCAEPKDIVFALRSLAIDRDRVSVEYDRSMANILLNVVNSFMNYELLRKDDRGFIYATTSCLQNMLDHLSTTLKLIQPTCSQLLDSMIEQDNIDALCEIYQPVRFLDCDLWRTQATMQSHLQRWDSSGLQSSKSLGQMIFDHGNFHETWLSFAVLSKQTRHCYMTVLDNDIGPLDGLFDATNSERTRGLRIAIRLIGPTPFIVGAIDAKNEISAETEQPVRRTQLWFTLLQMEEIIACNKVRGRDSLAEEIGRPLYNIAVHYSGVAILLLSMSDPDPAIVGHLLRNYRSKHPIRPLCKCLVNQDSTNRLAQFNKTVYGSGIAGSKTVVVNRDQRGSNRTSLTNDEIQGLKFYCNDPAIGGYAVRLPEPQDCNRLTVEEYAKAKAAFHPPRSRLKAKLISLAHRLTDSCRIQRHNIARQSVVPDW